MRRPLLSACRLAAVLLLGAGLAGCGRKKANQAAAPAPRNVLTAKVITKDVPLYLDEIGTCAAEETVQVQAQVSGRIIEQHFQDGADVKKGDLLFTIDPRPYQAALDQAEAQLAQARAQLALDQINLKRQQDLRAKNVTAQQEFDVALANVNGSQARVQSAEAAVSTARVNLDYCSIRAPIDGRAGLRQIDVGNVMGAIGGSGMSSAGTTPSGSVLVTIQRLHPIYTDFTVAETDLPLVRQYLNNDKLRVLTDAPDDQAGPREGKLYFIDNSVQAGAGTVKLRAETPNEDRLLWPGIFVRVRLVLDILQGAKLVPSQAVQIGQNGPYVFVVKPDSTIDLRPVKPGQRQGDLTVVNEGVQPGENVVVTGQLQLAPGAKVVAKEMTDPVDPAVNTPGAPKRALN